MSSSFSSILLCSSLTLLTLGACSTASPGAAAPPSADVDASSDASPTAEDAGADAGGCPGDSHAADDGSCVAAIGWAAGPALPGPRNHQMTWLVDRGASAVLYVAGGSDPRSKGLASVEKAVVNADGTLGAWTQDTPLPMPIIAAGVMMTKGEVILAGGYGLSTTWISKIQTDGSMGPWTAGPALPGAWFHSAAVAFQDFVYVTGGLDGDNKNIDQVVRARLAPDGSLGAWEKAATLPYVLSHHASIVEGQTLYVLGGETMDGVPRGDVLSAPLAADGTLGAWKHEPSLPFAVETHSSFVHDGSLYVMGGIVSDMSSTGKVARARLGADGAIASWVTDAASTLPQGRSHVHQTPIYKSFIYSVAGAPTGFPSTTGDAFVGTFH